MKPKAKSKSKTQHQVKVPLDPESYLILEQEAKKLGITLRQLLSSLFFNLRTLLMVWAGRSALERLDLLLPASAKASLPNPPASHDKELKLEEIRQLVDALHELFILKNPEDQEALRRLHPWIIAMIIDRQRLCQKSGQALEKKMHEEILRGLEAADNWLRHFGLRADPLALMAERQWELLEWAKLNDPTKSTLILATTSAGPQ